MSFKPLPAEQCEACEKRVYFNERVTALKKVWHKECFCCANCGKRINQGEHLEHSGDPFCATCHQKLHGARGFRGGSFGTMVAGNYDGHTPAELPSRLWAEKRRAESMRISNANIGRILNSESRSADLPTPEPLSAPASIEKAEQLEALERKQAKALAMVPPSADAEPRLFRRKSAEAEESEKMILAAAEDAKHSAEEAKKAAHEAQRALSEARRIIAPKKPEVAEAEEELEDEQGDEEPSGTMPRSGSMLQPVVDWLGKQYSTYFDKDDDHH